MDKFKQKYRIKSTRLPHWDYGSNGYYFVTICTRGKVHWFGEVAGCGRNTPHMAMSPIGELAQEYWEEILHHFPFVTLDVFVIMPNHVHGIVIIDKPDDTEYDNRSVETRQCLVSTTTPTTAYQTEALKRFRNQGKNTLSSIIGAYKSIVTRNARKINPAFGWQTRFHDHIIRNDAALNKIRTYIQFNVDKWEYDRENENDISLAVKRKAWKEMEETILI